MESKSMFITDEHGNEQEMEILFTFEHLNKKYVIFSHAGSNDDEVFASAYNDKGELLPVETNEEWQVIEEVIQAFSEEENE